MDKSEDIIDAVDELSMAITNGLRFLGNADASTSMGALEAHGAAMIEAADKIANAISDLAEAVRERRLGNERYV